MTDVFNDLMALRIQYQDFLLALPNVVGVGIGHKKTGGNKLEGLSLVTLVRAKVPVDSLPKGATIPPVLDGVQTDVVEVGH
ncbi:MAG: serine protease, partial [bacterium]